MNKVKMTFSDYIKKGNILHFDKFDFFDGHPDKKGRLSIVLQITPEKIVIATVTASFPLPTDIMKHGCIKPADKPYRGYHFVQGVVVGKNGYYFDMNSYANLYHNPSVFDRTLEHIRTQYFDKDAIEYKDTLTNKEYEDFIYCVYHSPYIKRGLKKYLEEELNKIIN
ncbi:MAG: hypothetical protein JWO09_2071 [Bacteroidetes bacterium]|nr:hypothetical protein [Bacteroidota bacterium]